MRVIAFILIVVISSLIIVSFAHNQQKIINNQKEILDEFREFKKQDSARTAHYNECAFISKDDVAIGYDGHFYSVDWRRRYGRE